MEQRVLTVLIACEESQAECNAFRELGHYAFSCDIQPCRKGGHPEWHIHGDVRPFLHGRTDFVTQDGKGHRVMQWDLIIAHPPCTYLTKLGAVHMSRNASHPVLLDDRLVYVNPDRYAAMCSGVDFFRECLRAPAAHVAVENPIPMRLAGLPRPSFYADPSWYGVKYTKKTLYWVKDLPPLMPAFTHPFPKCYVDCSRGKYRSRTFVPLARAIASQWSEFILGEMVTKQNHLPSVNT